MCISTSKYGDGHPALGHVEELPWMHMCLSRFQDLDEEERRLQSPTRDRMSATSGGPLGDR
eukprot:7770963-Alexandrium_andersonii.AAC.1